MRKKLILIVVFVIIVLTIGILGTVFNNFNQAKLSVSTMLETHFYVDSRQYDIELMDYSLFEDTFHFKFTSEDKNKNGECWVAKYEDKYRPVKRSFY